MPDTAQPGNRGGIRIEIVDADRTHLTADEVEEPLSITISRDLLARGVRDPSASHVTPAPDIEQIAAELRELDAARDRTAAAATRDPALLVLSAVLLAAPVRGRYREEWRGELYDLRAEGAPWWRRAAYLAGIVLGGAPRLAVITRRDRRRAVD